MLLNKNMEKRYTTRFTTHFKRYTDMKTFYAKELFYRSLETYKAVSIDEREQMINDIKEKMNDRFYYTGEEDEYIIASKWFVRLESYINNQLSKENN